MSRFDNYFLMKVEDIAEYVEEKLHFFPADAKLSCKEIGDGNLNYVFRLKDEGTGKSVIVKQAGESLRIDESMKLSTDRGRIEAVSYIHRRLLAAPLTVYINLSKF